MLWKLPLGAVKITPWCCGNYPLVLWKLPLGAVEITPWCCEIYPIIAPSQEEWEINSSTKENQKSAKECEKNVGRV